jgi:hypothetical protein
MELVYERVLDNQLINQENLTKTERVKVLVPFQITSSLKQSLLEINLR